MRLLRFRLILHITVPILLLASISSAADEPRRVLLLDSFEREFPPFDVFKSVFRSELVRRFSEPLTFSEVSVEPARYAQDPDEHSLLNYLLSTIKKQQLDLIVTIGGPATKFAQKYRDQLFPSTPLLFAAVDERNLYNGITRNSTPIASRTDPSRIIETILQVLPKTKNIAVVIGTSPLEKFWREELGREFQRFENQLTFTWFDKLSFDEMLNRSAALPANSAIFYVLFSIDAKGIAYSEHSVLPELHARANAPIFGAQSPQLGKGIVGGPLIPIEDISRKTASIAVRVLKGEAPEHIKVSTQLPGPNVFDWRELRRWNIDENRLPPGSIIRFRSPTAWDEYKWYVIVGGAVFLFEFILVAVLAVNLLKRKRIERSLREAERLAQDFNKQLIQAQEAERSRVAELERRTLQLSRLASQLTLAEQNARQQLASMLHDGLQQLLFSAGITLDKAVQANPHDNQALLKRVRANVTEAMEAARTLSVNLFPPVLHVGGLPVALSWLAKRTQEQYNVVVNLTADPRANPEAGDVRILLFEGVRELLFNAVKHAHVDRVDLKLTVGPGDTIHIQVSDEGIGFDPMATLHHEDQQQVGLGLFSIQERLVLLGGHLDVQSAPGKGARFILTVPRAGPVRLATDGPEARPRDTRRKERIVYDSSSGVSKSLRILIADDHAVVRAGLRELFSKKPPLEVVGEAANGVDAISQAMAIQPDVIVMDVSMPQMNGIEATREIHRALPHIQIVGLSTYDDENAERSMREAGAEAYFTKTEGTDRLLDYLRSLRAQAIAASGI
jgi:signal transduction histidine kinase/ABC-type uncharacterized transport system substrate-binding protein/ActR/RegA family two-component response regulator